MTATTESRSNAGAGKWNFLQRMRLWQKFALLGTLAVAAVAVPYVRFVQSAQEAIKFADVELSGIEPVQATTRMLQLMQQHRGLSVLALSGDAAQTQAQAQARAAKQAETEQAMAVVEKFMTSGVRTKLAKERWVEAKGDWKRITAAVSARTIDAAKSNEEHTEMIEDILVMIESIGDNYQLTLDPTAHTYFLVQAALVQLPALAEDLGQLRVTGAALLSQAARARNGATAAGTTVSAVDRAALSDLLSAAAKSSKGVLAFLDKAVEAEPRLAATIEPLKATPTEAVKQLEALAKKELLDAQALTFDATAYMNAFTAGVDAQYKLQADVATTLKEELSAYQSKLRRDELITSLEILAVVLVAAVISALTVRNITGTVKSLQGSVNKVRQGDFDALQAIDAKDEVGDLGRTVNDLLQERIAAQRKAEAENEQLNNSVINILQAVNQLSQRDLTAKAPVTQDVIGTVSDSINALTEETAKVLNGVSAIAGQVESVSNKVKSQAQMVSQTAEHERQSVQAMIGSLADATQTMNQVAALAEQSNASAEQATHATVTALQTVDGTVKGMESIRETIAETEKRIKRLGERSQEITGIVNLINTISERTHVLALNASMQAAVAGEAGRGFAVVAEEVQRLAESSRNATQQIGTLVNNIQLETNETINTVNRTIGQVVQGSELAQKAGEQMRRTQEITAQLVAQVRRIAESSDEQKEMSVQLLQSVQQIGQSTERTAQQIDAQNQETETLLQSARRLVDSVNVFKLPQAA